MYNQLKKKVVSTPTPRWHRLRMLKPFPFMGSDYTLLEFEGHVVLVVNNIFELYNTNYNNVVELISLTF